MKNRDKQSREAAKREYKILKFLKEKDTENKR